MHVSRLIFAAVACLAVFDSVALADSIEALFRNQESEVRESIEAKTGLKLKPITIEKVENDQFELTVEDEQTRFRETIIWDNPTERQMRRRLRELKFVVSHDLNQKLESIKLSNNPVRRLLDLGRPNLNLNPSFGAKGQVPLYAAVWISFPAVAGDVRASQWLRTALQFEGMLEPVGEGDARGVGVLKADATIWTVNVADFERYSVFAHVGTIDGALRMTHESADLRLEVGGAVTFAGDVELTPQLKAFATLAVEIGFRMIEDNLVGFNILFGNQAQVGLLLNNEFFVSAGFGQHTDFDRNQKSLATAGIGWHASDLITVKSELGYAFGDNDARPQDYDHYYLIPRGWNFISTVVVRY